MGPQSHYIDRVVSAAEAHVFRCTVFFLFFKPSDKDRVVFIKYYKFDEAAELDKHRDMTHDRPNACLVPER